MSEKSKLTAQETADVLDYVTITLRAMARPEAATVRSNSRPLSDGG